MTSPHGHPGALWGHSPPGGRCAKLGLVQLGAGSGLCLERTECHFSPTPLTAASPLLAPPAPPGLSSHRAACQARPRPPLARLTQQG